MRITFRAFAAPGELYGPGAFDHQIGRNVPLKIEATIVAAEVDPEGRFVELVVDLPPLDEAELDWVRSPEE